MALPLSQRVRRVTGAWSLNPPNLPTLLVAVTAFFLPTQLGRHFWPDWAYLQGLRSDYLSPTLYLTDLLIIFLLGYLAFKFLLERLVSGQWRWVKLQPSQRAYLLLFGGLIALSVLSTYNAVNPAAAWWHTGKLAEFGLWGAVLGVVLSNPDGRKITLTTFLLGCFIQALLSLSQFWLGHSVGFWILGERTFDSATPGIAQAILDGRLVLRSYGTLPHPNVLGFLMVLAGSLSLYLAWREKAYQNRLLWSVLTVVFSLAVITSLSRVAIILWLLATAAISIYFYRPAKLIFSRRYLGLILALAAALFLILPPVWSRFTSLVDTDSQTISQRLELSENALQFWREHPWSGVGLGNFVVRVAELPKIETVRFLQPAHNLYLLVLSEVGIIGLVFVLALLGLAGLRAYQRRQWLLLLLILEITLAGFFDHYFWSLEQGGLLFWSIIGGLFSPTVGREVIPAQPREPRFS